GQVRSFLDEFRESGRGKSQNAALGDSPCCHPKLLRSGKGQGSGHLSNVEVNHQCLSSKLPSPLKLAFEKNEHRVGRIALARVNLARFDLHFLRMAEEPSNLVFRQISEGWKSQQFRLGRHLNLAQILMNELHCH